MDEFSYTVVETLKNKLYYCGDVRALIWGGSRARGEGDEFSDLDFYLKVAANTSQEVFQKVGEVLSGLGELELDFHLRDNNGGLGRGVYRFQDRPFTETIEVTAHPVNDGFVYTKGVDDDMRVLFDKDDVVDVHDVDQQQFVDNKLTSIPYLRDLYYAQKATIYRQIKRESFLEAYMMYELFALKPLVKALRSKYTPLHPDYYLKDIYRDLPEELVNDIEPLYKVSSLRDIEENLSKVEEYFAKLV